MHSYVLADVGPTIKALSSLSVLFIPHADRHGRDISFTVFLFVCLHDFDNVVTDISGVGKPA